MTDKYNVKDDILLFLREKHTGAENYISSAGLEMTFNINGRELRDYINKLRCEAQPVCSDTNGYYYAKTQKEIDLTATQLLSRTRKITNAVNGLILSHQIFYYGEGDCVGNS